MEFRAQEENDLMPPWKLGRHRTEIWTLATKLPVKYCLDGIDVPVYKADSLALRDPRITMFEGFFMFISDWPYITNQGLDLSEPMNCPLEPLRGQLLESSISTIPKYTSSNLSLFHFALRRHSELESMLFCFFPDSFRSIWRKISSHCFSLFQCKCFHLFQNQKPHHRPRFCSPHSPEAIKSQSF